MSNPADLVKKAWGDSEFKKKLAEDPKGVSKDFGVEIPDDINVQVHFSTMSAQNYLLPESGSLNQSDTSNVEENILKVLQKADEDSEFRAKLLANPKATIIELTDLKIPDSIKINVVENDASNIHLIIPINPAESTELSDDDLEQVSGGKFIGDSIDATQNFLLSMHNGIKATCDAIDAGIDAAGDYIWTTLKGW